MTPSMAVCLDTGASNSVIDRELLKRIDAEVRSVKPISLKGVTGVSQIIEIVDFIAYVPVFKQGEQYSYRLACTA